VTVLHLLCHGAVADETAHLVWDDGAGAQDLVDPGALRRLLGPYAASLRLAVLCACGSGQPGGLASRLGSLAQALHRGAAQAPGGIEAVIASRFPLSTAGSCLLAEAFYPALLRDGLDAAFLAARGRMDPTGGAAAPGSLDHAALQVYAGAEEGAAGGAPAREDRPPSNLPARRAFVGRDEALGRLDEALGRAQRVSLVGIGGVGKTALAFEHAHRALERGAYPGGVWWIPAAGKPLDALLRLATALRACAPGRLDHVRPEAPAEEQAEAARIALQREPSPSLLVLDHVTEPGFLERIPGGEVRVLATARERRLAIGPPIALDPLDLPDARALAAQIAGAPADGAEAAACDRVVGRALGGLPVAVEVSARAAASWAGGWVAYEGYLAEQMAEALDDPRDRSELYPAGVLAALDASIARCPPGSPERALLEGASVFAPDAVPLAWAYGAAGVDAGGGAAGTPAARPAPPGGVPLAWKKALAALEGLLLVEVDREHATLSMHRLIDLRVAHAADPERWITASRRGAEHVAAWIGRAAGPARAQLEALDAARPHVEEALGAAERAGAEPAWIRIAHGLALHLRHRARFEEARAWSERALEKAERPAPSSPHLVAVSLSNLALLHVDRGRPAEGQPLLARALAVAEQAHGEDHPMVATILSNLALVHKDMGKPAEARPLLERALAIVEKGYGADHPHVATILSNLAKVLGDAGQAAEGRPLLERALAIHEKAYGAEHPRVAMDLSDLGSLARRTGDALGAQSLLERALAIHESTYGPSHPEVAKSLSNLAVVLRDLGRPTEARPLLERALAIDQAASGPAHPSVATRLLNLSAVLIDLGQVAEARPLLERAAAIAGEALPAAHPLRATLAQRLAHLGPGLGRAG
jgi:tetratricopeptide (TPR) repeat protein